MALCYNVGRIIAGFVGEDIMEQKGSSIIRKAEARWPHFRVTMLSALIFGILAHGVALVNKFSMVDDPQFLFDVGVTFR